MEESFEERIQRISRELNKDKKSKNIISWIFERLIFILFVVLTFCLIVSIVNLVRGNTYIAKEDIHKTLSKVIHNGGSLDEVKHVYDTRSGEDKFLVIVNSEYWNSHYVYDTPLSSILSDLLVEYYKQDTLISDSIYEMRLRDMISTYETIHPFDGLEESQKYYLENIRQKLDSNYVYIQEDLIKVGGELDRKNQLVNKYLDKSDLSFKISILALILTIGFSVWQIIQNNRTGKKLDLMFFNMNQLKKKEETENKQEPKHE